MSSFSASCAVCDLKAQALFTFPRMLIWIYALVRNSERRNSSCFTSPGSANPTSASCCLLQIC